MAWWMLGMAWASPELTGEWALAETRAATSARVEAAVEVAVAPLNFAIRALARPRLVAASTFCEAYALVGTSTALTVGCDGKGSITAAFDGTPTAGTGPDGRAFTLVATRDGATVTFRFTGEEGWQQVVYRPDGAGLRVTKTVHSSQLDRDVTWEMSYRRRAGTE